MNDITSVTQHRTMSCEHHGEYTSMLISIGVSKWTDCPECSRHAIEAENERVMSGQHEDMRKARGEAMFEAAGIPSRLKGATLRNYATDDGNEKAFRAVCEYARGLEGHLESGDGLILMGNMGTGKTHLAVGVVRAATRSKCIASRYITAPALFTRVRASYSSREETEQSIIEDLAAISLLVIDEIGTGKGSGNEVDILNALLTRRYDECRPTVIITNLQAQELKAWLGDRVVDRLRETSPVVMFDWESYRGRA